MNVCLIGGGCDGKYSRPQKEGEGFFFPGAAVTSDCELLG